MTYRSTTVALVLSVAAFSGALLHAVELRDQQTAGDASPSARVKRGAHLVRTMGCNDCHTPAGLVGKYTTKASNGFWHSFAFTTGRFHEPIDITSRNRAVTEKACRHCHGAIVDAIEPHPRGQAIACIACHASVGHPQ